ncbi:MAG: HlyD family efflux transporter periplasmic adaptor subunit, partial [Cohaesibacter sp.]|nr:HlyD family efflux transporter periplasmic adaptor subunit [Cohaesibacter sp.]
KAEENGAERFEMPDQLPIAFNSDDKTATSTIWDHDLKAMLRDQKQEFQSRKQRVKQDKLILSQQKTALDQQLEGVKAELASVFAQMAILKEQRISRKALIRQGYGRKVDLQETERDLAQLRGQQAQLQARQNSLPHQIAELQARLQNVESLFQEDISKEMADLRVEKLTLQKQFEAAQTAMSRVEVRAPTSGTVNKIHVNTIGSAVGAFQPLVEIVPDSKQILVEVEVQPMDIEQVRIGQKATLVLSAYEADKVAPV